MQHTNISSTILLSSQGASLFVAKPIYNVFGMLSLLGDEEMKVHKNQRNLTIIQTKTNQSVAILLASEHEENLKVKLTIEGLSNNGTNFNHLGPKYFLFKLNNRNTNPRMAWLDMGRPKNPTDDQIEILRKRASLKRSKMAELSKDKHTFNVRMPKPSVNLLVICYPDQTTPAQVTSVEFYKEGLKGSTLTWKYPQRSDCLSHFRIEHSDSISGPFKTMETSNGVFKFAQLNDRIPGWYRVIAEDVWNRKGPSSVPAYARFDT